MALVYDWPMASNTVQRNFLLAAEQADWLREHAFMTRRPQAEIVRQALTEYQARVESGSGTAAHERNRALTERFSLGRGIDLDVLRDEAGNMWDHDA
jgi:hypothetical protein